MGSPNNIETALRRTACHDDPNAVAAYADLRAWARAEGAGSAFAAAAIRRTDVERGIPGLPARRTFMVLGWVVLAAVCFTSLLSFVPRAAWIEALETCIAYAAAGAFVVGAAWSILSEIRGWEGSDASRWLLKRRVKAFRRALDARRRDVRDRLIAIGADRVTIYASDHGRIAAEHVAPGAIVALSLEPRHDHLILRLATRDRSWCFDFLPRDIAFETMAASFAARAAPVAPAEDA